MLYTRYARVAQEVKHWSPKPEDVGSKPTYSVRSNFEDALGIPLKEIEGGNFCIPVALELNLDDLTGKQEEAAEPDDAERIVECIRRHCKICKHE